MGQNTRLEVLKVCRARTETQIIPLHSYLFICIICLCRGAGEGVVKRVTSSISRRSMRSPEERFADRRLNWHLFLDLTTFPRELFCASQESFVTANFRY